MGAGQVDGMSLITAFLVVLAASHCQAQSGYAPQTPTTVPYDNRGLGSADLPLTDPRLASQQANADSPEQVNLIYSSPTSMIVRWSTGQNKVAAGVPGKVTATNGAGNCGAGLLFCAGINQCYPQGGYSCINGFLCPKGTCLCGANTCYTSQYGCKNGGLTQNPTDNGGFCPSTNSTNSIVNYGVGNTASTASGSATSYTVNPADIVGDIYVSGLLHQVTLSGLTPNTQYTYTVGDGMMNQSPAFTFKTLQAVNLAFSQYRIGVFADLGLTDNSSMTVAHLAASGSQAFINIGDFVYADHYTPNAADRWDGYYRFLQQFLSSGAGLIATEGNHEIETQTDGTTFAAYQARFGNAVSTFGGSNSQFYFSVNVPGAHIISLGAYTDYSVGGAQYNWLQGDLAAVNRAVTPFIVVISHPPVYNTYKSHYKEFECMRINFEPLLYKYGVDLAMYGHVHAYERTNRVYNYNNDPCGITHITVGDGGNVEQLQTAYVDAAGQCPAAPTAAGTCATLQNGAYCPSVQPPWSAFRESAFGHGTLDISPTALTWQWHRNQDGEPVVSDTVTITKSTFNGCANNH